MAGTVRYTPALSRLIAYGLLTLGAVVTVLPFVWMVMGSFKTDAEIFRFPPTWLPEQWRFENYAEAMRRVPFDRYFLNSAIVAGATVTLTLLLSSMAGYAFARLEFPGKRVLFGVILATIMIPFYVTLIPLFILVTRIPIFAGPEGLGWYNTYQGLIIPGVASAFGIFLMRQFFTTLPVDLEDAARIDGAGEWTIFWRVALPLAKPALAALGVLVFTAEWNEYLWPLVVTNTEEMRTVQLGLALFKGQFQTEWALLMAATVVVTLPVIAAFLLSQRFFIRGISLTGFR
jgi:multiple sugar transport system permease protein